MRTHPHPHMRRRVMPYPAAALWLRLLDGIVLTAGVIGPLFTLPQIYKIYAYQNAGGVSALSFGMWALLDIPWILYGFAHRAGPITITYFLWLAANIAVCIGALTYGSGL